MKFLTKLYLPAINQNISIAEMEYVDFIALQKYIINNDDLQIEKFLDYIIDKYVDYKGYISALDKFIILLFQRVCSVQPEFELVYDNINYKIDLNKFINQLITFEIECAFDNHVVYLHTSPDTLQVNINLPSKFKYKLKTELVYDCIYCVSVEDKINIHRKDFNGELDKIVPATSFTQIEQIVDNITESFSRIPIPIPEIFMSQSPENIKLNLSNGLLLELLKVFLRSNLLEWYQKNHFLLSKGHTLDSLYKCSPAEVNTYFKFIEEEAEEMAKASNIKSKS